MLFILQRPMAGVSGGKLAFQTSRSGGLGFIAAGHFVNQQAFDKLEREIKIFKDLSESSSLSFPLCIGFIGHSTFGENSPGLEYVRRILEEHKPDLIQIFAPAVSEDLPMEFVSPSSTTSSSYNNNVLMCQSYGCQVVAQVGSVKDGIRALNAGVDCLIAQGTEAGG
jgi:nitronate monooxygenase